MRTTHYRALTGALALAVLSACGGETATTPPPPPPKPTVTGTWTGLAFNQPTTLTLLETNGSVNGTGTIAGTPTGTRALTVTGILSNVNFSLTLSSGTLQPINYTGTLSPNAVPPQLVGTFTGSGFTGEAAILIKQP